MDLDAGIKFLNSASIHGTVIFGGRYTGRENYIQMLQKLGKPVIMAGAYPGDTAVTGFAAVRTELGGAWNAGISYLKSKGHQRIATITYPMIQGYENDIEQYRGFLKKEDIYHPEFIKTTARDYDSIKTAFLELMHMEHTPTAVMCYSDFYAIHLLKAAKEYGIKVPENLAVMGYCGFPGSAYLDPPLSTVDFHYFKMGETVMELLKKSGEWFNVKQVSPPDIIYPYEVLERKSTQTSRIEGSFL
jgi:DNA-binding LacI/PurR family transcriptional regulator